MKGGRERGREDGREGGRTAERERGGDREGGREGWREGDRAAEREVEREGDREEDREGERRKKKEGQGGRRQRERERDQRSIIIILPTCPLRSVMSHIKSCHMSLQTARKDVSKEKVIKGSQLTVTIIQNLSRVMATSKSSVQLSPGIAREERDH